MIKMINVPSISHRRDRFHVIMRTSLIPAHVSVAFSSPLVGQYAFAENKAKCQVRAFPAASKSSQNTMNKTECLGDCLIWIILYYAMQVA